MIEINVNVNVRCQDLAALAAAILEAPRARMPETVPVNAAPVPTTAPTPVPTTAPTPVPTAAPAFTLAQVAKAGAELMTQNPGMQPTLQAMLGRYGAQTVQEIPAERLGAFATELRQLGANI